MNKVLIIKDEEKFIGELLNSLPTTERLAKVIQGYEVEAVEFEAEITTMPFHTGHIIQAKAWVDGIRIPVDVMERLKLQGFKEDDKLQVFVVKKREEKDDD